MLYFAPPHAEGKAAARMPVWARGAYLAGGPLWGTLQASVAQVAAADCSRDNDQFLLFRVAICTSS